MKKNERSILNRRKLIRTALTDNSQGAAILRKYADQLDASRGTTERVQIIAELLGVSEALVFQEFSKQF